MPVAQTSREELAALREHGRNIIIAQAAAVEIELIGLVDQLNRARAVPPPPIVNRELHRELTQETTQIGTGGVTWHHAREAASVHLRSLPILDREHVRG